MRQMTLCFILKPDAVLLGMKKRGFGQGKWNGFGGKINPGENVFEATRREILEETGVLIGEMHKVGLIDFRFPYKPEWNQDVHVLSATQWSGEPRESEEMKPQWFSVDAIPYEQMWAPDKLWIPRILAGEKIRGVVTFSPGDNVGSCDIRSVDVVS